MLAIAMANRNRADTSVPATAPKLLNASKRPCSSVVATRDGDRQRDDDRRVAKREKQPDFRPGDGPSCINLRVTLSIAAM